MGQRGEASGKGGWEARVGLNPLLGWFGLAVSPGSASHRPKHAWRKRHLPITEVNFRPMPSM